MKKTLAIVGCGKLGKVVARALSDGILPDYTMVGTYSRTYEKARELSAAFPDTCTPCEGVDDLLALRPDYIVEAASPAAMKQIALPALQQGISIITLSIGAFADDEFYDRVKSAALSSGARVYVASGATGGFDVLRTVTLMGDAKAEFFNEKGPDALRGTAVYEESLQNERKTVFEGTATQAIELFPTKVNVTVAASRASVGPDKMKVTMVSTPGFKGDTQRVEISNPQVHAVIDVYSRTAEIAAWSVVRILQNLVSPIVF